MTTGPRIQRGAAGRIAGVVGSRTSVEYTPPTVLKNVASRGGRHDDGLWCPAGLARAAHQHGEAFNRP